MPSRQTIEAITRVLHPSRVGTYRARCGNDPLRALELYRWNLELSAAFQQVLAVTEVALRNAIDGQLRDWNATQPHHTRQGAMHGREWLSDPARPLNSMTQASRRTARSHAEDAVTARDATHPRHGVAVNHDDMVTQLTFGTWAKLLPTSNPKDKNYQARHVLWVGALHQAFPHRKNDPDGFGVAGRTARLHALRNRVSHMEPLLDVNVRARHNDALRLLGAISPEVRDWCAGISRVVDVHKAYPIER
ncbi:Abi family protein [Prescottella subtropica]|uniref:Abi family protein n=1 Tax=Prescottella subtropica TaxID=2545757 RepID=UPI0010F67AD2|nr:Abi family protein [Prescottella subtropica]